MAAILGREPPKRPGGASLGSLCASPCGPKGRLSFTKRPQGAQTRSLGGHGLEPPPQFNEKTPERDERTKLATNMEKLSKFWVLHPSVFPTLRAPLFQVCGRKERNFGRSSGGQSRGGQSSGTHRNTPQVGGGWWFWRECVGRREEHTKTLQKTQKHIPRTHTQNKTQNTHKTPRKTQTYKQKKTKQKTSLSRKKMPFLSSSRWRDPRTQGAWYRWKCWEEGGGS